MRRGLAAWAQVALLCGCSAPDLVPVAPHTALLDDLVEAGETAFARGDYAAASRALLGALDLARRADDAPGVGAAAYDLGACRLAQGRSAEAWPLFLEAEAALERAGRSRAAVRLLRGRARSTSDPAAARADFQRVAEDHEQATPEERAQAWAGLGHLARDTGDREAARAALWRSTAALPDTPAPGVRVATLTLETELAEDDGDWPAAARAWDELVDERRRTGEHAELCEALQRAGLAWQAAASTDTALERWYRAARSLAAAGQREAALALCERALALEAASATHVELVRGLERELRAAVEPPSR